MFWMTDRVTPHDGAKYPQNISFDECPLILLFNAFHSFKEQDLNMAGVDKEFMYILKNTLTKIVNLYGQFYDSRCLFSHNALWFCDATSNTQGGSVCVLNKKPPGDGQKLEKKLTLRSVSSSMLFCLSIPGTNSLSEFSPSPYNCL